MNMRKHFIIIIIVLLFALAACSSRKKFEMTSELLSQNLETMRIKDRETQCSFPIFPITNM